MPQPEPSPITACLLHANYHVMTADCWNHTLDWMFEHYTLPESDRRNAYQTEVEQAILRSLRKDRPTQ